MDIAQLGFKVDTSGIKDGITQLDKLDEAGKRVTTTSDTAGGAIDRSFRNSAGGVGVASGAVGGLATKLSSVAGIAAAGLGFAEIIGTARDFEAAMNGVQEKLNVSGEALDEVREFALDMGATTAFSASQAVEAIDILAASGNDARESMALLPDVLNLAASSSLTLGQSADIVINALNQFGVGIEDSTRVVDLFAGVADSSGSSVEQLSSALQKVGPFANSLGVSMEETAAMIGVLADNGVKAELAGTGMASMIARLTNAAGDGADALEELGLSSDDFIRTTDDGSEVFIGFTDSIRLIESTGATATQRMRILGQEAGKSVVPAFNAGADAVDAMRESFGEAASAAEQAQTKLQGLPGALQTFTSTFKRFQLALADSGGTAIATKAVEGLTGVLKTATGFIETAKEKIEEFEDAATWRNDPYATIRSLVTILQDVVTFIKPAITEVGVFVAALAAMGAGQFAIVKTASAITGVVAAVRALGVALAANPIGLAIAAIGASVYVIYDNWDGIVKWWDDLWGDIVDVVDGIGDDITQAWDGVKTYFNGLWTEIAADFVALWNGLKTIANSFIDWWQDLDFSISLPSASDIVSAGASMLRGFVDLGRGLVEALQDALTGTSIRNVFADMFEEIPIVGSRIADALRVAGEDGGEGFAQGIERSASDVQAASVAIGEIPEQTIRAVTETQSPSKALMRVGNDVSLGLAVGISQGSTEIQKAAGLAGDAAVREFDRLTGALLLQRIELVSGEEPARRYSLALNGITGEAANAVIASEQYNERLRNQAQLQERIDGTLRELAIEQGILNAELNGGAKAAELLKFQVEGYSAAEAQLAVDLKAANEKLREQQQIQDELSRGIKDAIVNADSVKDAFRNLGDFMKSWLKQKIAEFAANKVMVFLGLGDGGFTSGLGGIFAQAGSMMSSFSNNFVGGVQSIGTSVGKVLGGTTNFVGSLDAAQTSASGATEALTGMGGTLSAVLGKAGIVVGTMAAVNELGKEFGRLVGAADEAKAGIGAMAFGSIGATIGAALGGSWKHIQDGFELAFQEGDLTGRSFQYFEKERSLWRGTAQNYIYSELDVEVANTVTGYFSRLNDQIVTSAEMLGVSGASAILDNFEIASRRIASEEDMAEFLEDMHRQAYQIAFNRLSPELQAITSRSVDLVADSIGDIEEHFSGMALAVDLILPTFEAAGIALGNTFETSVDNAMELTNVLGGAANAQQLLTQFYTEFVPEAERAAFTIEASKTSLERWNEQIGYNDAAIGISFGTYVKFLGAVGSNSDAIDALGMQYDAQTNRYIVNQDMIRGYIQTLDTSTESGRATSIALQDLLISSNSLGLSAITTRDQLYEYIKAQDSTTEAGQAAVAAALQQMDAIIALEEAQQLQAETTQTVADAMRDLNVQFDMTAPGADAAANAIVELMGGLDEFTSGVQNYMNVAYTEAERTQLELAKNAKAVQDFNAAMGLSGQSTIDTVAELRAFEESLGPYTEANAGARAAVYQIVDAVKGLEDSTMTAEEAIASLPPEMQSAFELITGSANDAGDVMGAAADTMLVAADGINRAFGGAGVSMDNLGTITQQTTDTMVAAANDANIEVNAAMQGMAVEAGEQAKKMGLQLKATFTDLVTRTGAVGDEVFNNLNSAFTEVVASADINGADMADSLRQAFTQVLGDAGVVRDNLPNDVRAGFDEAVEAAAGMAAGVALNTQHMANESAELARQMQEGVTGQTADMQREAVYAAETMNARSLNQVSNMSDETSRAFLNLAVSGRQSADYFVQSMQMVSSATTTIRQTINTTTLNMVAAFQNMASAAQRMVTQSQQAAGSMYSLSHAVGGLRSTAYLGSFSTGLDYVPVDGYMAETHKGEMIVRADIAEQLRGMGVTATSIGAANEVINAGPQSVSSTVINTVQQAAPNNANNGLVMAVNELKAEVMQLRADAERQANKAEQSRSSIASLSNQQNAILDKLERTTDRSARVVKRAVS